jgi:hypothetical protein
MYSLPTLMRGYLPSDIVAVPVVDVEPGSVVIAWPAKSTDALVESFVSTVADIVDPQARLVDRTQIGVSQARPIAPTSVVSHCGGSP